MILSPNFESKFLTYKMTHCWLTNCWGSIRRLPAVVYPATCSSLVKSQQVNGETLTDQAGYFNFGLRFSNSKFQSLTGRACLTIAPECTRALHERYIWRLHSKVAQYSVVAVDAQIILSVRGSYAIGESSHRGKQRKIEGNQKNDHSVRLQITTCNPTFCQVVMWSLSKCEKRKIWTNSPHQTR